MTFKYLAFAAKELIRQPALILYNLLDFVFVIFL